MVVSTVAMGVSIEKKRHTTTIHPTLGMSNSVEVEEDLHSGKNEVVVAKEVSASILKATVTKITQTSSTNKTEETQIASKEQIRSITEVTYLDSRCTVCDSTYHWMKDCPHNTTFTMYIKSKIQEFTSASLLVNLSQGYYWTAAAQKPCAVPHGTRTTSATFQRKTKGQ